MDPTAKSRFSDMVNNGCVEPDEPAAPAAIGQRGERSPRDMAMSLAVLLIPIALLLVFYRVVLGGDSPSNVDPGPALDEAREAALFPVTAPGDLGDRWHVVSATFRRQSDGATLRLGYVDPGREPIQLIESSVAPETLVPAELGKAPTPSDTFRSAERVWRLYIARPGEHALVLTEQHRTIIVVGSADTKNLETLAASLP
jgi:uncharacterized protein DUF4245